MKTNWNNIIAHPMRYGSIHIVGTQKLKGPKPLRTVVPCPLNQAQAIKFLQGVRKQTSNTILN